MKVFKLLLFLTIVISLSFLFAAKTCPKCGVEYADDYKYCTKCGALLIKYVKIPNVVGTSKEEAIKFLESKGFRYEVKDIPDEAPPGNVLRQSLTGIAKEGSKITLWVATGPLTPKWLRKMRSFQGWPVQGKCVAGIFIGSSVITGKDIFGKTAAVFIERNLPEDFTNRVIDTLGKPDYEEGNWLCYRWGNNELKVFSNEGRVDTIMVLMSESLKIEWKRAIEIILGKLGKPEEGDSVHKFYPEDGISFLLQADTIILGLKIFVPRKEPLWVKMLKNYYIDFKNFSAGGLGIGMYSDSIETLFGAPQFDGLNTVGYEYLENRFFFSIVGGEIDTISISLSQELFDSLRIPTHRESLIKIYGDPVTLESIADKEELFYPNLGLNLIFENGVLDGIKMYTPEYYNMVLIPAGYFWIGTSKKDIREMRKQYQWDADLRAETPKRKILLNYDFYIDKYEVTNRQFKKFVRATNYEPKGDWKRWVRDKKELDNHPVVGVTWEDAKEYAKWVGKRLPCEIEWEKAARCSLGFWFPWGDSFDNSNKLANYNTSGSKDSIVKKTVPVDSFAEGKSKYGVFNMAGNVMEWCANPYIENYYKIIPPKMETPEETGRIPEGAKPQEGGGDILISARGGAFCWDLFDIRSPRRFSFDKNKSRGDLGFRCVKDVKNRRKK